MTVRVPGKVNLALKVGAREPDGYHRLATVFQAVSIFDEVDVSPAEPGTCSVTVSGPQAHLVPTDDSNLAVKAARALAQAAGISDRAGVRIAIKKDIPVTGGMAGGSADCAGALLACAQLWDLDSSLEELQEIGRTLGSDVPFAFIGGTALGTGRGDRVTPVLSRGKFHWVLAFSDGELSTPVVFRTFDRLSRSSDVPVVPPGLFRALAAGDTAALGAELINDLEPAALALRPQLRDVLAAGIDLGAIGAVVSGSGPTCAFLAANELDATSIAVGMSSMGLCRGVRRVCGGSVPGAQILRRRD